MSFRNSLLPSDDVSYHSQSGSISYGRITRRDGNHLTIQQYYRISIDLYDNLPINFYSIPQLAITDAYEDINESEIVDIIFILQEDEIKDM